jgi:hypothetical protein
VDFWVRWFADNSVSVRAANIKKYAESGVQHDITDEESLLLYVKKDPMLHKLSVSELDASKIAAVLERKPAAAPPVIKPSPAVPQAAPVAAAPVKKGMCDCTDCLSFYVQYCELYTHCFPYFLCA